MRRPAKEIEVEVVPDEVPRKGTSTPGSASDDPFIAFMARLMDSAFVIPGTKFRFGLDPILGLFPGLGDTVTAAISALLVAQSARYGVPKPIIAKMMLNVLVNSGVGAIPVIGDVFSAWFKSNVKNYELLRTHAGTQKRTTWTDWAFVGALVAAFLLFVVLVVAGMVTLLAPLFGFQR